VDEIALPQVGHADAKYSEYWKAQIELSIETNFRASPPKSAKSRRLADRAKGAVVYAVRTQAQIIVRCL
jgi:hypothetical protein